MGHKWISLSLFENKNIKIYSHLLQKATINTITKIDRIRKKKHNEMKKTYPVSTENSKNCDNSNKRIQIGYYSLNILISIWLGRLLLMPASL